MNNALIVIDDDALRRWLRQDHSEQVSPEWRPTAEDVADLVDMLDDDLADHNELARAGWTMTQATSIFAHLLKDNAVVFGADIAGGGRIASIPQYRHLRDSHHRTGVEAAVETLRYASHLLNEAYPHEFI